MLSFHFLSESIFARYLFHETHCVAAEQQAERRSVQACDWRTAQRFGGNRRLLAV